MVLSYLVDDEAETSSTFTSVRAPRMTGAASRADIRAEVGATSTGDVGWLVDGAGWLRSAQGQVRLVTDSTDSEDQCWMDWERSGRGRSGRAGRRSGVRSDRCRG